MLTLTRYQYEVRPKNLCSLFFSVCGWFLPRELKGDSTAAVLKYCLPVCRAEAVFDILISSYRAKSAVRIKVSTEQIRDLIDSGR